MLSPENMIYKGLNDEEAVFLQQLADKRAQVEAETRSEEREELQAYRVCEDQYTNTTIPILELCNTIKMGAFSVRDYIGVLGDIRLVHIQRCSSF